MNAEQTTHSLELAKSALSKVEGALDGSKNASIEADKSLTRAKETYKLHMALRDVIGKHDAMNKDGGIIIENLIEVTFFRLNQVDLSDVHAGSFVMTIAVTVFQKYEIESLSLHFDLNDLTLVCKELAEYIGKGFGRLF